MEGTAWKIMHALSNTPTAVSIGFNIKADRVDKIYKVLSHNRMFDPCNCKQVFVAEVLHHALSYEVTRLINQACK